jgi:hypothetical protein
MPNLAIFALPFDHDAMGSEWMLEHVLASLNRHGARLVYSVFLHRSVCSPPPTRFRVVGRGWGWGLFRCAVLWRIPHPQPGSPRRECRGVPRLPTSLRSGGREQLEFAGRAESPARRLARRRGSACACHKASTESWYEFTVSVCPLKIAGHPRGPPAWRPRK